jgi:hypothetical protein
MSYRFDNRGVTLGFALLGGLAAAIVLGRAVAFGQFEKVAAIISLVFGATLVLALGRRYWYAIPVTLALQLPTFQVGARNIDLGELSIMACTLIFITRLAFKREQFAIFTLRNTPFILYIAWVTMVYCLHPIGFAGIGSMMGGARFYLQVYLAFAALVIIASQDITEEDIKWVFWLVIGGSFLSLGRTLLEYFVLGRQIGVAGLEVETEGFYTWHQALASPALVILLMMFSYWAPSKIFTMSHPWRGFLYILCIPAVLLSGKRAATLQLLGFPAISALLRRELRFIVVFAVSIFVGLSVVIYGQGNIFSLPLAGQRALSWLPGDWDPELRQLKGGNDDFRKALREIAWEEIQRDPWISDGFSVDIAQTSQQYHMTVMMGAPDIRDQVMVYAMGKAWHNTWLGYSADFGIPLAVIQAFIFLTGIAVSYRLFYATKEATWFRMVAAYALMTFIRDVLASHTSGHSASDAFSRWWIYGMVFALARQLIDDKKGKEGRIQDGASGTQEGT